MPTTRLRLVPRCRNSTPAYAPMPRYLANRAETNSPYDYVNGTFAEEHALHFRQFIV